MSSIEYFVVLSTIFTGGWMLGVPVFLQQVRQQGLLVTPQGPLVAMACVAFSRAPPWTFWNHFQTTWLHKKRARVSLQVSPTERKADSFLLLLCYYNVTG